MTTTPSPLPVPVPSATEPAPTPAADADGIAPTIDIVVNSGTDAWAVWVQGPVSAVLAALGLAGVYWWTRTDERKKRAEDRANERADLEEDRLLKEVATLDEITSALQLALMYGEQDYGPIGNRMITQMIVIGYRERSRRPAASDWFLESATTISGSGAKKPAQMQHFAGRVKLSINAWAGEDLAESAFGTKVETVEPLTAEEEAQALAKMSAFKNGSAEQNTPK